MPEASDRGSQPFRHTYGMAVWLATPIKPLWGIRLRTVVSKSNLGTTTERPILMRSEKAPGFKYLYAKSIGVAHLLQHCQIGKVCVLYILYTDSCIRNSIDDFDFLVYQQPSKLNSNLLRDRLYRSGKRRKGQPLDGGHYLPSNF